MDGASLPRGYCYFRYSESFFSSAGIFGKGGNDCEIPSAGARSLPSASCHHAPRSCEDSPASSLPTATRLRTHRLSAKVIRHIDKAEFVHVVVVVTHDALKRIHARFLRRHAVPQVFYDGVRSRHSDVLFPAAGRARRPNVLIGIAARADDRRVARIARKLERQAAGRGSSGNLALLVQRGTMNRAGWRKLHAPNAAATQNSGSMPRWQRRSVQPARSAAATARLIAPPSWAPASDGSARPGPHQSPLE